MIKPILLSAQVLASLWLVSPAIADTQRNLVTSGFEGFFISTPAGETYLFPAPTPRTSLSIESGMHKNAAPAVERCIPPPAQGIYQFYGNPGWYCGARPTTAQK